MIGLLLASLLSAQDINSPRFFYLNVNNVSVPQQLLTPTAETQPVRDPQPALAVATGLRFPLSLFGRTKIIGEVAYDQQNLIGFYDPAEQNDDDLTLRGLAFSILVWHQLSDEWNYFSRLQGKNNSTDVFSVREKSSIVSLIQVFEKSFQKLEGGKIGFGTYLAYRDRFTLLPVFYLQGKWSRQWELDILLPSKILIYHYFADDFRLLLGARGKSDNYYLEDEDFRNIYDANFRRISANPLIGIEKQLSKLLGVGFEAGVTLPLFSGIFERDIRWKQRHSFEDKNAPYFRVTLFCSIDKSSIKK